jgi:DNA-binding CsgD family transcriptional regulator
MSQHLSREATLRYRMRTLPHDELIAASDHLAVCPECREKLATTRELSQRLDFLRTELNSSVNSDHVSYPDMEGYVDKSLNASRLLAIDEHLKTCTTCTEELRELESYKARLMDPAKSTRILLPWLRSLLGRSETLTKPSSTEFPRSRYQVVDHNQWRLFLWSSIAAVATAAVLTWTPSDVRSAAWRSVTIGYVLAICFAIFRRVFGRFLLLNLYWISGIAASGVSTLVLRHSGAGSSDYVFTYWLLDMLQSVLLFGAMSQLCVRMVGAKSPGRKKVLVVTATFFLLTLSFGMFVWLSDLSPLSGLFVEISSDLFFVAGFIVLLAWIWRIFYQPADRIAGKLLTVTGSYVLIGVLYALLFNLGFIHDTRLFFPLFNLGVSIGWCYALVSAHFASQRDFHEILRTAPTQIRGSRIHTSIGSIGSLSSARAKDVRDLQEVPDGPGIGLNPTEVRVLQKLADGRTPSEIGQTLGMSTDAVIRLCRRLGCESSTEAWIRLGVPPKDPAPGKSAKK